MMRLLALALILAAASAGGARAQDQAPAMDYATQASIPTGTAPGLTATELSPHARLFQLTFAKGDDVRAGLADFAVKNHLTNAHFTAIGALDSAVIGWSDRPKKAFKVIRLNEEMEIASLDGSITRDKDGRAHTFFNVCAHRGGPDARPPRARRPVPRPPPPLRGCP